MYLSPGWLGTYSPVLSSTWIDYFPSSLHSQLVECKTQRFSDQWKTPLHFSPSLRPNKPLTLALVCDNTFGPTDHPRWVCIHYLHIWSYLVCVWKPPHQTKGKVLRKTLQVLAVPGEVPISRRYLLEQGNCSRATETYNDLVGQWSQSNCNRCYLVYFR
jgi:hypothetical protein